MLWKILLTLNEIDLVEALIIPRALDPSNKSAQVHESRHKYPNSYTSGIGNSMANLLLCEKGVLIIQRQQHRYPTGHTPSGALI
jgi:hypothetical protein